MPTAILRPNADLATTGWNRSNGGLAYWEHVDDAITQPTNASTSGDGNFVATTTLGNTLRQGYETITVDEVTAISLWVWSSVANGVLTAPSLTFTLNKADGTQLAVGSRSENTAGWTEAATGTVSLSQSDLDSIEARFTATGNGGESRSLYAHYILVTYTVAPTQVAISQTLETNTPQAFTASKTVALGQPSETDTARAFTASKSLTLGQPSETESAFPFVARKAVALGQPAETDAAQPFTVTRSVALGQASETDTALSMTARKVIPLGLASETDSALGLTVVQEDDGDAAPRTLPLLQAGT